MAYTTVDIDYSAELSFDGTHVKKWFQKASPEEIAAMLSDTDVEAGFTHYIGVNAGQDSGSEYDLAQIKELFATMHVSDILAKLRG